MCDKNLDPYKLRAMKLFNVTYSEVTKPQRDYAKRMMHLEIYSMKPPVKRYNDLHW